MAACLEIMVTHFPEYFSGICRSTIPEHYRAETADGTVYRDGVRAQEAVDDLLDFIYRRAGHSFEVALHYSY